MKLDCTVLLMFLLNASLLHSQHSNVTEEDLSVEKIVEHFRFYPNYMGHKLDSVSKMLLYKTDQFDLSISNNLVQLDTQTIILENPYYSEKWDAHDDHYIRNYPASFSTIAGNTLISLFANGKFVCHSIPSFNRDLILENKLNSKRFIYHRNSGNALVGCTSGKCFRWDGDNWVKIKQKLPIRNQTVLFEDDKFVAFNDCHGEWGGTVYFFDKETGSTYYTESTCSNTIIKHNDGYLVLAKLGHMIGSSELKFITNPQNLSKAKKHEINQRKDGQALGYSDKSGGYQKHFDLLQISLFSMFHLEGRRLFIANLNELTFLVEIKKNKIEIVHPLLSNDLYTHNPLTSVHGDYVLINLDHYSTAKNREVAILLITTDKIIKLDWNE